MSMRSTFTYEWKHLIRSPFKLLALTLFVAAAVYGLHNGAALYDRQMAEVDHIREKEEASREKILACYDTGSKFPDDAPANTHRFANVSEAFWAIWLTSIYHVREPSPAMVYSIGQAEQYGFYKELNYAASPYAPDMAEEIANPERLQSNPLDYAFVLLYLQPLLLLILFCNLRSAEAERGLLPLIEVQARSVRCWLMARMAFYVSVVLIINMALLLYGASLTGVLQTSTQAFGQTLLLSVVYLLAWSAVGFVVLSRGRTILSNSLQIAGIWLLFAFIVPAAVHRAVGIRNPDNMMTGYIDAGRQLIVVYDLPEEEQLAMIEELYPGVVGGPVAEDETRRMLAMQWSRIALISELTKQGVAPIKAENEAKNRLIRASYWFNPINFFQNQFNSISQTHYDDYQLFRDEIQSLVDKQNRLIVIDTWGDVKVDKEKYLEYMGTLNQPELES